MDRMNDDEKFDMWLKSAAQDYRSAPRVPREEMWSVIAPTLPSQGRVAPSRRVFVLYRVLPMGLAAAALIAVGVQIGRRTQPAPQVASSAVTGDSAGSDITYTTATVAHLGRAEALITEFRASSGLDEDATKWARDLLSDTRLLIDSPAATDPRRRQLLQDLELVLAQLVQLDPAATADDSEMVHRSIERAALLMRLRTAVPAGFSGT
jgi:hypothetical protein